MEPYRNNLGAQVSSLWEDAWDRVPGSKRIFLAIVLLSILAGFVAGLVSSGVHEILVVDGNGGSPLAALFSETFAIVLAAVVGVPFVTALVAAGLERARGNPITVSIIMQNQGLWLKALVAVLAFRLLEFLLVLAVPPISLGPLFLQDSGFSLSFLLLGGVAQTLSQLALLNIVDSNASPVEAIRASFQLVIDRPLLVIIYVIAVAVSSLLIGLTFGIAAIWFIPFLQICLALIYLRHDEPAQEPPESSATVEEPGIDWQVDRGT